MDHSASPPLRTIFLPTMSGANSFARLSRLYDLVRSLTSLRQLDKLLDQIIASAADMLEAKGAALLLLDPSGSKLSVAVTSGRNTVGFKNAALAVNDLSVEGTVALHGT